MIKQVYETICETNDKIINTGQPIESFVFFIKGKDSATIPLKITAKNKDDLSAEIKSAAIKKGVDGYVLVMSMVSQTIKKGKKPIPEGDCVIRVLYTREEKYTSIVWYKYGRIIDQESFTGRGPAYDIWDAWNVV